MKRIAFSIIVAASMIGAITADGKPKLTPEQREERKYRHFGGHIYQPVKSKVVSILDEQSIVERDAIERIASEMQSMLMLPVAVNASSNVAVRIRLRADEKAAPLVIMPDNAIAIVDVKALSVDKPAMPLLETRLSKEIWRGFVYVLGGGNTYVQNCVMKQVSSLKDLDAIPSRTACPDAYLRIAESARAIGLNPLRRVTYRQACKEGWAPQPTNDVQKAIWDQIHAIPDKPITIEFDPKKDK